MTRMDPIVIDPSQHQYEQAVDRQSTHVQILFEKHRQRGLEYSQRLRTNIPASGEKAYFEDFSRLLSPLGSLLFPGESTTTIAGKYGRYVVLCRMQTVPWDEDVADQYFTSAAKVCFEQFGRLKNLIIVPMGTRVALGVMNGAFSSLRSVEFVISPINTVFVQSPESLTNDECKVLIAFPRADYLSVRHSSGRSTLNTVFEAYLNIASMLHRIRCARVDQSPTIKTPVPISRLIAANMEQGKTYVYDTRRYRRTRRSRSGDRLLGRLHLGPSIYQPRSKSVSKSASPSPTRRRGIVVPSPTFRRRAKVFDF